MPLAATRAPYTLFIVDDDMPPNPREDYDCLGKMVCWHGRYSLGEKHDFEEPRDFLKDLLFSEYSSSHDRSNPVFAFLTRIAVALMHTLGLQVAMPALQPDAFPFWDSCMMVLSVAAMILMTRKYVENWLLWVIINVISVVIFALQGVYAMSLEYLLLTFIALNGSRMWINSARERGSHAFSR